MMRILLLAAVLLLSACASQAPLPAHTPELALPLQLHIQRKQAGQWQDWLLVLQREDAGLRWSLLDPLGIPLARQRLVDGQWQADGLLPPNPEARELFALFQHTVDQNLTPPSFMASWASVDTVEAIVPALHRGAPEGEDAASDVAQLT